MFEVIVNKEGMEFLGWREVPTDPTKLGQKAVDCMPYIMQGFVKRPAEVAKDLILTANCMWQDVFLNSPTMILMWFLYPAEPSYTKVCS